MSLTAFAAGHLVGGAVWQVLTREGEQLVYAVHWNHRKDRHLQRADLGGRFSRPALLITDTCSALKTPLDTSRRDHDLVSRLLATLKADGEDLCQAYQACKLTSLYSNGLFHSVREVCSIEICSDTRRIWQCMKGCMLACSITYSSGSGLQQIAGNVLIPTDTAGRSLELALVLENAWRTHKLLFPIVLLTPVAYSTLEFAKSQLEWMNQDISEAFNKTRSNPFEFRSRRARQKILY